MIRRIGFAPWDFEFHFPGSLTSTFLSIQETHLFERLPPNANSGCPVYEAGFRVRVGLSVEDEKVLPDVRGIPLEERILIDLA